MSTVKEIVSDPEFSKFSTNDQVEILRKLKGDEVANDYLLSMLPAEKPLPTHADIAKAPPPEDLTPEEKKSYLEGSKAALDVHPKEAVKNVLAFGAGVSAGLPLVPAAVAQGAISFGEALSEGKPISEAAWSGAKTAGTTYGIGKAAPAILDPVSKQLYARGLGKISPELENLGATKADVASLLKEKGRSLPITSSYLSAASTLRLNNIRDAIVNRTNRYLADVAKKGSPLSPETAAELQRISTELESIPMEKLRESTERINQGITRLSEIAPEITKLPLTAGKAAASRLRSMVDLTSAAKSATGEPLISLEGLVRRLIGGGAGYTLGGPLGALAGTAATGPTAMRAYGSVTNELAKLLQRNPGFAGTLLNLFQAESGDR